MTTHESDPTLYDICVIGGGINGCGIARDAAGRGYKTLLLEKHDLASSTSSKSTKLIHGGLRYLEQYEFRLVHESLNERNRLIKLAPHIITPLTFVLPHESFIRPYWLIRLGLYVYDFLGITFSPTPFHRSHGALLSDTLFGKPLKKIHRKALSYSDGWVDDSRLVALNARDAQSRGASINTYEECKSITSRGDFWHIETNKQQYKARLVVNAGGPWVRQLLDHNHLSNNETPRVRLVKGSHIIIPRLYDGEHAYILQQDDKRVVFTIPYQQKFTLVGTTEEAFDGDLNDPHISNTEIDYLLNVIEKTFIKEIDKNDIVSHYSGVRALYDDQSNEQRTVTRDYKIVHDRTHGNSIVSVFGGKITTFRALSAEVLGAIDRIFKRKNKEWTLLSPLPGGNAVPAQIMQTIRNRYPKIERELGARLVGAYGSDALTILQANSKDFLVPSILRSEIDFCISHEFVRTPEDYLWRRSKMGLHLSKTDQDTVSKYIISAVTA